jgi:hypothetical protein
MATDNAVSEDPGAELLKREGPDALTSDRALRMSQFFDRGDP